MVEQKEDPELDPNEVPEVVPEKIKNPLDIKALIGIAVLVISFQVVTTQFLEEGTDLDTVISVFSFLNPLILAIVGFTLLQSIEAHKYLVNHT